MTSDMELELLPKVDPSFTRLQDFILYDVTYELDAKGEGGTRVVDAGATFMLVFEMQGKSFKDVHSEVGLTCA